MLTGLFVVLLGVLILLYPHILVVMIASVFILFGFGMMAASWQFRRLRRRSNSPFMNWIIRW
ncbi:MAG: hypothetical protein HY352_03675 [Candidatus Omnitrophica bacterium]|nr:hypothetical protein [Candidatus Omnitrophota bacterium]